MKERKKIKRLLAGLLVIAIFIGQITYYSDVVLAEEYTSENVVIQARKISKTGSYVRINGKEEKVSELTNLTSIIRLLNDETEVYDSLSFGDNQYRNEKSIYSHEDISINANLTEISNIIVAEKNIDINSTDILSDNSIIYSKNGNININASNVEYKGIIYAPNGTVSINGSKVKLIGAIIADKANISAGIFEGYGNDYWENQRNILSEITTDVIFGFSIFDTDTGYSLEYNSDVEYEEIDIYVRHDNDNEFVFYDKLNENKSIEMPSEFQYLDVFLIGTTRFGEKVQSEINTYFNDNNEIAAVKRDSDNDGIEDGVELKITKTNPYAADSDEDGINDYTECFYLYTDPNKKEAPRDYDEDGLTDYDELKLGTSPFLADSDFDGYMDMEDINPTKYDKSVNETEYDVKVIIGPYDKVLTSVDENGQFSKYVYDPINRLIKSIQHNEQITVYYYDADKNPTVYICKNNDICRINNYKYDENGNVVYILNNGDVYEYTYDNLDIRSAAVNGNEMWSIDRENGCITYGNGDWQKTVEVSDKNYDIYVNDIVSSNCAINDRGQLLYYRNNESGIEYFNVYDETGRLQQSGTNQGISMVYSYEDDFYEVTYLSENEARVQRIYYNEDESRNKYVELISGDILEKKCFDDYVSYVVSNENDSIVDTRYEIKDSNIVSVVYKDGTNIGYTYDVNGRITEVYIDGNKSHVFEYMADGQLKSERDVLNGIEKLYYYDSYYNIERVEEYAVGEETNNKINEYEYKYESQQWGDLLTEYDGQSIKYDAIGNPIKYYNGMNMEWDGNQLKGISCDETHISYYYNIEGIRNRKIYNDTVTDYVIEGKDIIAEITDGKELWYIYDENNGVVGFSYEGCNYFYEKNAMNDIIRIIDENSNAIAAYSYDAWGNITDITGNMDIAELNPFRYKSYYYDKESGLYYLRSRYYDSKTGRFINADDLELLSFNTDDTNMYAYCCCNPVMLHDPYGNESYKVSIFSISEFQSEMSYMKSNLIVTGMVSAVYTKVSDTKDGFVSWWNSLDGKDVGIINSHGTEYSIGASMSSIGVSTTICNRSDVDGLKKINVKVLLILGCKCGHYTSEFYIDTIANHFAKRITGIVIASDQDVTTKYLGGIVMFISEKIEGSSYGWMVYNGTYDIFYFDLYAMNMPYIMNFVSKGYYKNYK